MSLALAYVAMILIWASTPLAIQSATTQLSPEWAALGRVVIGGALGLAWLLASRRRLPTGSADLRTYFLGCINVFTGVLMTFHAAQHLVSGMICVIFGFSPIVSTLMSRFVLDEPGLRLVQWLAVMLGLSGLGFVFMDELDAPEAHRLAVLSAFGAVCCFCAGNVLLKRYPARMGALEQTTGTLLMAIPLFAVSVLVGDESPSWPSGIPLLSMLYLGIGGSLAGVMCQYYVLSRVSSATIALSTFMTPPIALLLGYLIKGETLSLAQIAGTVCVLAALLCYFSGHVGSFRQGRRSAGVLPHEHV
jgi:drug/metabolite transporter (DMT)-like permease